MSAHPIIPGQLYRVRVFGQEFFITAPHGCDALTQAMPQAMASAD